ncbi:hypothetical protein RIF29_21674 [Crotalaria pallida]|uniref:Uncharacterized protein n=1 Tax=Crotalaria pallida TaxID=3830 RepID=A0AAN9F3C9_CROPI
MKVSEFLALKLRSKFAKFCKVKCLKPIHPMMESSFFGNLNQRNLVSVFGWEVAHRNGRSLYLVASIEMQSKRENKNTLSSGEFRDTNFFTSFTEMAEKVWLLHCLAFSFEPQASIFKEKMCLMKVMVI